MPPPPQLPHPPHTDKSELRNRDEEVVHVIEDADAAASSVEHGSKWRRLTLSGDKHDPRSVFVVERKNWLGYFLVEVPRAGLATPQFASEN